MNRGYGQYCTIALGAEVFAERWTPLIIRNLALNCHRFGEIQEGCPGLSTTLLAKRLRSLERDGVVSSSRAPSGRGRRYELTDAGRELGDVVLHLGLWGARYREISPRDQDPYIALWTWARKVDIDALPPQPVVVCFRITDRPDVPMWMLLRRPRPEVCVQHPGGADDLVIRTDVATLVQVQRGRLPLRDARERGEFVIDGDAVLARDFPGWGGISDWPG